jgi:hypothetical protein
VKKREPERWLVRREELERFIAEREPPAVVLGYDLTCSAPKSAAPARSCCDHLVATWTPPALGTIKRGREIPGQKGSRLSESNRRPAVYKKIN